MQFIQKLMLAKKLKIVLSSVGVLALVLFTSFVVFEATKKEVTIVDNGQEQVVHTHKKTVEELFSEVGIVIGIHDALSHEKDAPIEDGMTIDYKTAKQVIVTIDGESETYYTTEENILAFLKENDLSVSEHDDVSHSLDEAIEDGLEFNITKAFDVVVVDGGEKLKVKSTGGTVEELLEKNKIKLNDEDKITPKLNDKVTEDTKIEIVRVTTEMVVVEETIEFKTERKEDHTIRKGEERVITQGQNGQVVKKYKVTLENGEEVERELVEEDIQQEAVNRVIAVGTKEPVQQASSSNLVTLSSKSSDEPTEGKTLPVTASAFTATCSGCSGVTSTGINLKADPNQKVIAVDPSVIPLGSKVWVEGYGVAVAGDTGGAIKGNRIDVHVPSTSAAYEWGVRTVTIKILE